MPVYHLKMELAEPRVVGKASFGRRVLLCVVDRKKILAQYDTPLQFTGSLVGHTAEVDDASLVPVILPVVGRGFCYIGETKLSQIPQVRFLSGKLIYHLGRFR